MVITAGVSVSEASRTTSTPRPAGIPRLWKYGVRVRCDDHVRRAAIHKVVRRQTLGTGLARLLIAAQQEDRVVRRRRYGEQRQKVGRVRRQWDDTDVAEVGHHAAGGRHLDRDRHKGEQCGE
jgi:hypothetical protein